MPHGRMAYDRLEGINFDRMRKYRLQRTKDAMAAHGVGTLITWDPYAVRYICGGYVTIPNRYSSGQGVVLPRNGDPYCFYMSSFARWALQQEAPWWPADHIMNGGLGPGRATWTQEGVAAAAETALKIIADHGLLNEPVALDSCAREWDYMNYMKSKGINVAPNGTEICFEARAIKNQDEIACFRLACNAADAAFADIRDAIRPGVRECDLMGIGMKRLYEMGCDETQEFVVASGPRTNPMHIDFTDRAINIGDGVIVDINGASYMGYKTCYYRTFICGKATQEQKDIYEEARKMMYDAMDVIKDGATVDEVRAVWPKSPQYWGYDEWSDVGGYALAHGLGISLHESPTMFFAQPGRNGKDVVFKEGMVLAVETWAGKRHGNFGVRLEEDIVVTKDGYELLTKWPVDQITECWL